MKYTFFSVIIFLALIIQVPAEAFYSAYSGEPHPKNFIENKGQWNSSAYYLTQLKNMNIWIDEEGLSIQFYRLELPESVSGDASSESLTDHISQSMDKALYKSHTLKLRYRNSFEKSGFVTDGMQRVRYHYFVGQREHWKSNVRQYDEIVRKELYEGISVRYYNEENFTRFDYLVEPGANVSDIRFTLEGSTDPHINESGEIELQTVFGEIRIGKLYAYQAGSNGTKEDVSCSFKVYPEGIIGIETGAYDRSKKLIIDPLVYSTYLGGGETDICRTGGLDSEGYIILGGNTYSPFYPTTPGVLDTAYNALGDVFITKMNVDSSEILYSTFLGGSDTEWGNSLVPDSENNLYITGWTKSDDFPVSSGAFSSSLTGGFDAYVAKLSADGSSLIYATYIGGSESDWSNDIYLSANTEAVITGYTDSEDFPATGSAFSQTLSGSADMFAAKVNADGTGLIFSTYVGGSQFDEGSGAVIGANGVIMLTGRTASYDFPLTQNAFDDTLEGSYDAFFIRMSSDGSTLDYSTFLGGSGDDRAFCLDLSNSGDIVVSGASNSTDFPVSDTTLSDSSQSLMNIFLAKFTASDSLPVFSRLIGGSKSEIPGDIRIDDNDNIHLTGITSSENFPLTKGVYDITFNGNDDIFYTIIEPGGSFLLYSTFLGGTASEEGSGVFVNSGGDGFILGMTASENYPVTDSALNVLYNGGFFDIVLSRFSIDISSVEEKENELPGEFVLNQNYPNPFNPSTKISFAIAKADYLELAVYTILGEKKAILAADYFMPGRYEFTFQAENLPSGVYFYRLSGRNYSASKKMILLK